MRVLITGSRKCSDKMSAKLVEVMNWIKEEGHSLIVGDARGIDQKALGLAHQLGIWDKVSMFRGLDYKSFLARDRVMVLKCDVCVAIWNGESRGTLYTFNFARSQGKKVILRTFI
jgi:predicted Rossmann fold nucleotide-binding protein DprA/Smf involved in DNA uptake